MKNKTVRGVVREVATMQGVGVVDGSGGTGSGAGVLQTKAGGYILTKGGLRILVK